ncbi:hypothetical protein [Lacinutrix venerupis]|nr:hypothetical protein [Lacinutrix venerupis]
MKFTIKLFALFFVFNVFAQRNMDTIYGNPKSVSEKIVFLKTKVAKRYTEYLNNSFRNIRLYKKGNLERFFGDRNVSYVNCKIVYNKKGLREKELWYNFSEEIERTFYYSYDKNNNLIEENEVYWDDEFWLVKYHYNRLNKPIAMSYYNSLEPNEFVHWYSIRDENNNVVERRIIDGDGEDCVTLYELNKEEKVIRTYIKYILNKRKSKKAQSKFQKKERNISEYRYDERGNKIQQLNYNTSTNNIQSKQVYKYDDRNYLIEYKNYWNISDTTNYRKVVYNYNNKGFKTYGKETTTNDSTFSIIKTFYNKNDYILKTIVLGNNKSKTLDFKYKFDRKGNWTKITKIVNGEPFCVWTRKIKYY